MKEHEKLGFLTGEHSSWNKNIAIHKIVKLKEGDELTLTKWNSDIIDVKIIRHIFRQKTPSFYLDQKISFDIGPLIKDVYGSSSAKYYEEVRKRLLRIKMTSYEMEVKRREPGSNGVHLAWYLFATLYQDHDAELAEVVVSEFVFEQLIIEENT